MDGGREWTRNSRRSDSGPRKKAAVANPGQGHFSLFSCWPRCARVTAWWGRRYACERARYMAAAALARGPVRVSVHSPRYWTQSRVTSSEQDWALRPRGATKGRTSSQPRPGHHGRRGGGSGRGWSWLDVAQSSWQGQSGLAAGHGGGNHVVLIVVVLASVHIAHKLAPYTEYTTYTVHTQVRVCICVLHFTAYTPPFPVTANMEAPEAPHPPPG